MTHSQEARRVPPFRLVLDANSRPGLLRVSITFESPAEAEHHEHVRLVLLDYVGLARSGALGGDVIDPTLTTIEPEPPRMESARFTQGFHDVQLDPSALTCLLNVLEWIHHHVAPIATARVEWSAIDPTTNPEVVRFPAAWPRLSYPLEHGDLDRRFTVEISFAEPQTEKAIDQFLEDLGAWFTGVNRGAYGDDRLAPARSCVVFTDDVMDSSPDGVTWHIDALHASDAALDGLVNVLERIHRTRVQFANVQITS